MGVDGVHLVRQGIDLRHGNREVGIVLEGQPDAVGLGREPEVGGIAVQGGELPGLGDRDGAVEVRNGQKFGPRALRVDADSLHFHAVATGLRGQHLDGLGPMRALQEGAFGKLTEDIRHVNRGILMGRSASDWGDRKISKYGSRPSHVVGAHSVPLGCAPTVGAKSPAESRGNGKIAILSRSKGAFNMPME